MPGGSQPQLRLHSAHLRLLDFLFYTPDMRFVSLAAALGVTKPEAGLPGSLAQDVFGFTTLSKPHRLRPLLRVQARMKSVFQASLSEAELSPSLWAERRNTWYCSKRRTDRIATLGLGTVQPCACIQDLNPSPSVQPRVKYESPHCQPAHRPTLLLPVFMETPHQSREMYELHKYKG